MTRNSYRRSMPCSLPLNLAAAARNQPAKLSFTPSCEKKPIIPRRYYHQLCQFLFSGSSFVRLRFLDSHDWYKSSLRGVIVAENSQEKVFANGVAANLERCSGTHSIFWGRPCRLGAAVLPHCHWLFRSRFSASR